MILIRFEFNECDANFKVSVVRKVIASYPEREGKAIGFFSGRIISNRAA